MTRAQIQTSNATYLIRGPWTVAQLRAQYQSFIAKYGDTLSLDRWLVERGKVYFRIQGNR